jgi:hypothetical protein
VKKFVLVAALCAACGCSATVTKVRVRVVTTPVASAAEADVVVEFDRGSRDADGPAARLVVRLPAE